MGAFASRDDFVQVPDSELTPCAIMLKQMNVRLIIMGFEGVMTPVDDEMLLIDNHHCIPEYTQRQMSMVSEQFANNISEDVSTLIMACMAKGIVVNIVTKKVSCFNGSPKCSDKDDNVSGYIYQGKPFIQQVLDKKFGHEVAQYIQVEEGKCSFRMIQQQYQKYKLHPIQVLVISAVPKTVKTVRDHNMLGILIEDMRFGLHFTH